MRDAAKKREIHYWSAGQLGALAAAILLGVVVIYAVVHILPKSAMQGWPSAEGRVLRTDVLTRLVDSTYGGRILLTPQLEVTYPAAGSKHTRWFDLPGRSDVTRPQLERLMAPLVQGTVIVRWNPRAPQDAIVEPGSKILGKLPVGTRR